MSTIEKVRSSSDLISQLQEYGLFQDLSLAEASALEAELEETSLPMGEWLFRQGDPGNSMYVLDRGALRVVIETQLGEKTEVDKLFPGAPVGEMALLTGQARTAAVQAMTDSGLIRLTKTGFDRVIKTYPQIGERIGRLTEPRFQRTQLAGVLSQLLGKLDIADVHEIQKQLEWRRVVSGEIVYRQGDPGEFMVIVVNGRLRMVTEYPDLDRRITCEVGRGESAGEFSLLTGEPREATVCAVRDSDLLILTNDNCEKLIQQYPRTFVNITRNLALRLQRAGLRPEESDDRTQSMALVPINDCEGLTEFAHGLTRVIEHYGPTLFLSADKFDQRFGKEGAAQICQDDPISIAIIGWLNRQEMKYRHIVYQADCEWNEWTRRCVRQSDRIVFVADAGQPLPPTRLEQAIADLNLEAQKELVLIYRDPNGRPSNTAGWLATRELDTHHHLRIGSESDCLRVARRLTDRAIGLVLSGGSARGMAHLGIYRAMKELGIQYDMIGGASMGSLLGAMFAVEYDLETMLALGKVHLTTKALMDYTFPAVALCQTKKITQLMKRLYGDVAIEDLFTPYFCVSSNLSKSRPVIHKTGPLWLAVRASIAIPGVFTPVSYQGDLLVDGGAMNNLPIDIMREQHGVGYVIANLASPKNEKDRNWEFQLDISGWKVLGRRLNPFAKPLPVPSIGATIMRTLDVNSSYLLRQTMSQADVFIEPDTSGYENLNWEAYPNIVEIGYEAALESLSQWQSQNPELEGILW